MLTLAEKSTETAGHRPGYKEVSTKNTVLLLGEHKKTPSPSRRRRYALRVFREWTEKLVLVAMEGLHIDGVLHSETLTNAGLVELLTATEFFHDTGSFKLSLKLLEGAFDVLAFLYGYYNHFELLYLLFYE